MQRGRGNRSPRGNPGEIKQAKRGKGAKLKRGALPKLFTDSQAEPEVPSEDREAAAQLGDLAFSVT